MTMIEQIRRFIDEHPHRVFSPDELRETLAINPWTLRKALRRLMERGQIKRHAWGRYGALDGNPNELAELERIIVDAVSGMDHDDMLCRVKVHYADGSVCWLVDIIERANELRSRQ